MRKKSERERETGDDVSERERDRETEGEMSNQTEDYHGTLPRERSCI